MKYQWKNTLVGFIVGCMFVFVTTVMPINASSSSLLEVVINNVNIMLDGNVVGDKGDNYTLSNGNQVPFSIVYKGTTYVPIRKLGELLGKEIGYISDTSTVVIGAMPVQNEPGWYLVNKEFTKLLPEESKGTFLGTNEYFVTRIEYTSLLETNVALTSYYTTYDGYDIARPVVQREFSYTWTSPPVYIPVGGNFNTTVSCTSTEPKASISGRYLNDSLNPTGDGSYYSVLAGSQDTIYSPKFGQGYDGNQKTITLSQTTNTDATVYTYTYEYKSK